MPLSNVQTATVRILAGQAITNNLLRLLALSPSNSLSGSVGTADLEAGAVTAAKATPGAYFYGTATGPNVYALNLTPALAAHANGVEVVAKFTNGNTAADPTTLNVNGLGAKAVYHRNEQAVLPGDIQANDILRLRYNSSRNSAAGGWDILEVLPSATIRRAGNVTTETVPSAPNAQEVVNTPPLTAYTAGLLLLVKVGAAMTNTGAFTLKCDNLATRAVKRQDGSALRSQDWQAGLTYLLYDDGTQFIILSKEPSLDVVTVGAMRNLIMMNNVATPDSQVDIDADEVVLKTSDGKSILHTSVNLTVNAALGVALNGFETGVTEAASTWYYVWLISNGTTIASVLEDAGSGDGAIPLGPDLSNAAFAGYAYNVLVGAVRNDGSSNFVRFWQRDREAFQAPTGIFSAYQINATGSTWTVLSSTQLTALRAATPPIAVIGLGLFGTTSTVGGEFDMAIAACKDDGTADTLGAGLDAAGARGLGICIAAGDPQGGNPIMGYQGGSSFRVPLRGGANRNVQCMSADTNAVNRLTLTGYSF